MFGELFFFCFRVLFVCIPRRWPRVDIDEFGAYINEEKSKKIKNKNEKKNRVLKNRKNKLICWRCVNIIYIFWFIGMRKVDTLVHITRTKLYWWACE